MIPVLEIDCIPIMVSALLLQEQCPIILQKTENPCLGNGVSARKERPFSELFDEGGDRQQKKNGRTVAT